MLEIGTSGLMSGEGKRAAATIRPRTAPLLDSTHFASGINLDCGKGNGDHQWPPKDL